MFASGFGMFSNPHTLFGGPVELVRNAIDEPNRYIFSRADIDRLGLQYPITNEATLQYVRNPNAPWSNTSINTNFPNPYSIQWMLSIQRQLKGALVFETAYVGHRGVKLNLVREYNQVDRLTGARPDSGFLGRSATMTRLSPATTIRGRISSGSASRTD